jgi:hypothetical protein
MNKVLPDVAFINSEPPLKLNVEVTVLFWAENKVGRFRVLLQLASSKTSGEGKKTGF